jgi:hypothetical protein
MDSKAYNLEATLWFDRALALEQAFSNKRSISQYVRMNLYSAQTSHSRSVVTSLTLSIRLSHSFSDFQLFSITRLIQPLV